MTAETPQPDLQTREQWKARRTAQAGTPPAPAAPTESPLRRPSPPTTPTAPTAPTTTEARQHRPLREILNDMLDRLRTPEQRQAALRRQAQVAADKAALAAESGRDRFQRRVRILAKPLVLTAFAFADLGDELLITLVEIPWLKLGTKFSKKHAHKEEIKAQRYEMQITRLESNVQARNIARAWAFKDIRDYYDQIDHLKFESDDETYLQSAAHERRENARRLQEAATLLIEAARAKRTDYVERNQDRHDKYAFYNRSLKPRPISIPLSSAPETPSTPPPARPAEPRLHIDPEQEFANRRLRLVDELNTHILTGTYDATIRDQFAAQFQRFNSYSAGPLWQNGFDQLAEGIYEYQVTHLLAPMLFQTIVHRVNGDPSYRYIPSTDQLNLYTTLRKSAEEIIGETLPDLARMIEQETLRTLNDLKEYKTKAEALGELQHAINQVSDPLIPRNFI